MNNPEEKTALTRIEIIREADYLRETLENGMPAFPTSDFLNRCRLNDCLQLLELIPFDVSLNLPYRQRKPLYLTKAEIRQQQHVGLYARCFGTFELFCDGKPVSFQRRQTKELFAYLIDREGAAANINELNAVLWEEDKKSYLRNLIVDIQTTLKEIGAEDVFIKRHNECFIDVDKVDCDAYEYKKIG